MFKSIVDFLSASAIGAMWIVCWIVSHLDRVHAIAAVPNDFTMSAVAAINQNRMLYWAFTAIAATCIILACRQMILTPFKWESK